MMTNKQALLSLLGTLLALMIQSRDRIRYEMQGWPAWWKIAAAVSFSVLYMAATLFSVGLLDDFLQIFNINFPQ